MRESLKSEKDPSHSELKVTFNRSISLSVAAKHGLLSMIFLFLSRTGIHLPSDLTFWDACSKVLGKNRSQNTQLVFSMFSSGSQ